MKLVFIYGLPAVGKLTVAKELSKITGYKIFHNHLTVDLASSVFSFGTKPFVKLREEIWLKTFELSSKYKFPGIIFTFSFEKTVRKNFISKVKKSLNEKDNLYFVQLICSKKELFKRIKNPSRKRFGKLIEHKKLDEWQKNGTYFTPKLENSFQIDNTKIPPKKVAKMIKIHYKL